MIINFFLLYILSKINPDTNIPCELRAYLKLACVIYWLELSLKVVALGLLVFNKINLVVYMNNDVRYLFFYVFVNILNFSSYIYLSTMAFSKNPSLLKKDRTALLVLFSFISIFDAIVYAIALYFEKRQIGQLQSQVGVIQTIFNTGKELLNGFLNPPPATIVKK